MTPNAIIGKLFAWLGTLLDNSPALFEPKLGSVSILGMVTIAVFIATALYIKISLNIADDNNEYDQHFIKLLHYAPAYFCSALLGILLTDCPENFSTFINLFSRNTLFSNFTEWFWVHKIYAWNILVNVFLVLLFEGVFNLKLIAIPKMLFVVFGGIGMGQAYVMARVLLWQYLGFFAFPCGILDAIIILVGMLLGVIAGIPMSLFFYLPDVLEAIIRVANVATKPLGVLDKIPASDGTPYVPSEIRDKHGNLYRKVSDDGLTSRYECVFGTGSDVFLHNDEWEFDKWGEYENKDNFRWTGK